jgi:antitoxin (DNA-binding transcriptional repressor) of toxin-antitoxin stability system
MTDHSVAEAKARLSELIERAVQGETVVITRHGRPMVELKAVTEPPRPVSAEDLDWLAERRVRSRSRQNAGKLLESMRDEQER